MGSTGALREVMAFFGVEFDTKQLEAGEKKVDSLVDKLKGVGKTVASAFAVHEVKEFFETQIEGAAHLQDLAERLDISASALRMFGGVAKGTGLDLDSAAHSMGFLNAVLGKAKSGNAEAAQVFAKLRVETKNADGSSRNLLDVVGDVSEAFSKMPSQQERAAAAMALFGREGRNMVPILSKGREELRATMAEFEALGDGLGDKFPEDAKKAREEGERFGFAIASIKNRITAVFLPGITSMLTAIKDGAKWFLDMSKKTLLLQEAAVLLGGFLSYKFVGILYDVAKALGIVNLAALPEIATFALVTAGGLALWAIFDDIYNLFSGGKSLIGSTIDDWYGLGTSAKFVDDVLRGVAISLKAIREYGSATWQLISFGGSGGFDEASKNLDDFVSKMNNPDGKRQPTSFGRTDSWFNQDRFRNGNSLGNRILDDGHVSMKRKATSFQRNDDAHNKHAGVRQPKSFENDAAFDMAANPLASRFHGARVSQSVDASTHASTVVHQTNHISTVVHGAAHAHKTGDAVGQGVTKAVEKANNNAHKSYRIP